MEAEYYEIWWSCRISLKKYRDSEKLKGERYIEELTGVANILVKGYGLEYRVTALFRNRLLKKWW